MHTVGRYDRHGTLQDYKHLQARVDALHTNLRALQRGSLNELKAKLEMVSAPPPPLPPPCMVLLLAQPCTALRSLAYLNTAFHA